MPIICLEGPDGTGKSTMISMLKERLESFGHHVETAANPGATQLGQLIRRLVKQPSSFPEKPELDRMTEQMLMVCDYNCFVETRLRPSLAAQKHLTDQWFLLDRCNFVSGLIYGLAGGVSFQTIKRLYSVIDNPPLVDWLFVLMAPPKAALQRRAKRDGEKCQFEERGNEFMQDVSDLYGRLLGPQPQQLMTEHLHYVSRFVRTKNPRDHSGQSLCASQIDASGHPSEVFDKIVRTMSQEFDSFVRH